jgi:excisionase family DNA binding protein
MPCDRPASKRSNSTSGPASTVQVVPRLLTIKQAAAYLSCAVWQVRTLLWSKEIAHIKLGKKFLIDRNDLDLFVDRRLRDASRTVSKTYA